MPQETQNWDPPSFRVPHFVQYLASAAAGGSIRAPQETQNRAFPSFFTPHRVQYLPRPVSFRTGTGSEILSFGSGAACGFTSAGAVNRLGGSGGICGLTGGFGF